MFFACEALPESNLLVPAHARKYLSIWGEVEGVGLGFALGKIIQVRLRLELEAHTRRQLVRGHVPHFYHSFCVRGYDLYCMYGMLFYIISHIFLYLVSYTAYIIYYFLIQ